MRALLAVIVAAGTAGAALGDEVSLRGAVRAPEGGGPVTIGTIAELSGPDAERLAGVVLVEDPSRAAGRDGTLSIDVGRVRAAMDGARVNWARVMLSGSKTVVRVAKTSVASPVELSAPAPAEYETVETNGPVTVKVAAALALAALYGVDPADLRLRFDPGDAALLATLEGNRRVEARPQASERSERTPIAVTIYEGDRIVTTGGLRADVLLAREGATLVRSVRKGATLGPEDVRIERVWLAPGFDPAAPGEAIGSVTRSRLAQGSVVRPEDLETPLIVRKGDLVSAHCISGGVVVKTPARALSDARAGELVECRVERSKKTFLARADSKGRVVVDVTPATVALASGAGEEDER